MSDLDRILPDLHPADADAWVAGLLHVPRGPGHRYQPAPAPTHPYGSWSRIPTLEHCT